jgi:carbohydrate kinase (thermoresistant glucokinase family)
MPPNPGLPTSAAIRTETAAPVAAIILMGVAGSGKTTIGRKLADALGWSFCDGDDLHPEANVAKMSRGIPLDDRDREPWLAAIRAYIGGCLARGEKTIVACSALREKYRRALVTDSTQIKFVHLAGSPALILERLQQRHGHFMRPEMLDSQFAALEQPADALVIDIAQNPDAIVAEIRRSFHV